MTETPSFWHTTLGAASQPSDELPATADVAVVGGGLLGAATALWLARAGARPVLLERGALAAGATGRNGGLMVPGTAMGYTDAIALFGHADARAMWSFTERSIALLEATLAEEGLDCDYQRVGHLSLALSEEQLERQRAQVAALQADGFAAQLLDREALREWVSVPLGPAIWGGLRLPSGGTLHSARLVRELGRAARRHGALVVENAEVRSVESQGDGLRLETAQGPLLAGRAVLALNAWAAELVPGLRGLITPVRGQALAYAPTGPVFGCGLSAGLTPTGEYWQQRPDGAIVLGGCRAAAPGGDIGERSVEPTAEVQRAIEGVLPQLFPEIGPLRVAQRWAGPMAFTADHTPVADRAPELPHTWVVGGFSGHGMPYGMLMGRLLAEAALAGADAPELRPFRLSRPTVRD